MERDLHITICFIINNNKVAPQEEHFIQFKSSLSLSFQFS